MKRYSLALVLFISAIVLNAAPRLAMAQTDYPPQTYATPTPAPTNAPKAKPRTKVIVRGKQKVVTKTPPANPQLNNTSAFVAPTPTPAPAPPPSPWKLVFYTEYQGPRLSDVNFGKTADDVGTISSAEIDSFVQAGYAVSKNVVLGTRIRANYIVDPESTEANPFYWRDIRLYGSWSHMIETKDIDMQGVLVAEFPTTDASRGKGKLFAMNIQNNWTLKTALRNWSFSALTVVRPIFYSGVSTTNDLHIEIDPDIVMDLSGPWQLQIEGYFSTAHSGNADYFDFNAEDADTIDIGPIWNINSHLSLYPALRFYTGNLSFNTAEFYVNFSAAL